MLITILAGLGCTGSGPSYEGYDMVDHFPLDGQRKWTYANEAYDYNLRVELVGAGTPVDNMTIETLEFWQLDENNAKATLLAEMQVSSDTYNGVLIHGFTWHSDAVLDTGDTGDSGDSGGDSGARGPEWDATYDPPVTLADRKMAPFDVAETTTGGTTWTSEFVRVESCPNHWVGEGENAWTCLYMHLDDGDGDARAGAAVAGDFWMAPRYGLSWFQLTHDEDKWVLAKAEWEADE